MLETDSTGNVAVPHYVSGFQPSGARRNLQIFLSFRGTEYSYYVSSANGQTALPTEILVTVIAFLVPDGCHVLNAISFFKIFQLDIRV
jgi:hypothetical protein